jgi:hypothetical protein
MLSAEVHFSVGVPCGPRSATWQADRLTNPWNLLYRSHLKVCLWLWGRSCGFSMEELKRTMGKTSDNCWRQQHPGKWIWRRRRIAWPPRSPDLTPINVLLWGHLKEHVDAICSRSNEDLVARIQADVTTVDVKACSSECRAMPCRLRWNGRSRLEHVL